MLTLQQFKKEVSIALSYVEGRTGLNTMEVRAFLATLGGGENPPPIVEPEGIEDLI
jgi:hypothetical protein